VRDSTASSPARTVAASSSGPSRATPTDVTCVPGDSHSRRSTGAEASVQTQTTSATRTASSTDPTATAPNSRASVSA
jgi:hypothetical protein